MPDKNQDKDVPWSKISNYSPVIPETHPVDIPIFWGPGQKTGAAPKLSEWHRHELLSIPTVARFIYATDGSYNSDNYPDDDPDPGPNEIWIEFIAVGDHTPPFIHNTWVLADVFKNGIAQNQAGYFTYNPTELNYSTFPPTPIDLRGFYTVGLKFHLDSVVRLQYQMFGTTEGAGYYPAGSDHVILPF